MSFAIQSLLEVFVCRSAAPWLAPELGRAAAERALGRAFARAASERPDPEPGYGGRLMLRCAAATEALYRELLEPVGTESDARRLTARVTAGVYRQMAAVPWLWARTSARSPIARLRAATGSFRRFPFGPPAYRMRDVPCDERTVGFDVERCPVAEYFRARGLRELCKVSFCDLDYSLARSWGARLERTTTLAEGGPRCDFRWHVLDTGPEDSDRARSLLHSKRDGRRS